jgi:hypothetical protein
MNFLLTVANILTSVSSLTLQLIFHTGTPSYLCFRFKAQIKYPSLCEILQWLATKMTGNLNSLPRKLWHSLASVSPLNVLLSSFLHLTVLKGFTPASPFLWDF